MWHGVDTMVLRITTTRTLLAVIMIAAACSVSAREPDEVLVNLGHDDTIEKMIEIQKRIELIKVEISLKQKQAEARKLDQDASSVSSSVADVADGAKDDDWSVAEVGCGSSQCVATLAHGNRYYDVKKGSVVDGWVVHFISDSGVLLKSAGNKRSMMVAPSVLIRDEESK